jgi:hypothetical protein
LVCCYAVIVAWRKADICACAIKQRSQKEAPILNDSPRPVPELTRSKTIKLNARLSLQRDLQLIGSPGTGDP